MYMANIMSAIFTFSGSFTGTQFRLGQPESYGQFCKPAVMWNQTHDQWANQTRDQWASRQATATYNEYHLKTVKSYKHTKDVVQWHWLWRAMCKFHEPFTVVALWKEINSAYLQLEQK